MDASNNIFVAGASGVAKFAIDSCGSIHKVSICGKEIFIPDAFSPNGDHVNDTLYVRAKLSCIKTISFSVFNRWGQKVFETSDLNIGWNGGQNEAGVYHYFVDVTFLDNSQPLTKKGSISLIR